MRKISEQEIINAISELCYKANTELPKEVLTALKTASLNETETAKDIIKDIINNADIALKEHIPLCQDTGTANFFIRLGNDIAIECKNIYETINKAVSQSYTNNYLRKSIVSDPLKRENTNDNTPANIYIDLIEGDKIEITFLPKGGGSENACALKMLNPADGWSGVKDFVLNTVKEKGANACPPLIIGIGIGGDFASVGLLAKKALLRNLGDKNINPFYNQKEIELLEAINNLNIGPMGLGGKTTALSVFIETKACHIASLPVAVCMQCHSHRIQRIII
jgi:fumarate hydratase subunit alpha